MLLFAGDIVVDEFEFCADTTSPVAASAMIAATISIRYLVVLFFTVVLLFLFALATEPQNPDRFLALCASGLR